MSELIERQAALECFHCWIDKHGDVHEPDEMPEYQRIEALPSAQPMRPKGKWIADNYGNTICSECRWYAPKIMQGSLTTRKLEYYKSDFCWKCGADMRGDPNE